MTRPGWFPKKFSLADALTFGLAAVVATALTLWAQLYPGNKNAPTIVWVIAWLTAAGFWALYAALVVLRIKFVNGIRFMTSTGVMVRFDDDVAAGTRPTKDEMEFAVADIMVKWTAYEDMKAVTSAVERTLVVFKPLPFTDASWGVKKLSGLAWPVRKTVWVGAKKPLSESALGHEIGHVIMFTLKGTDSEEVFHEYATGHQGIPY